MNRDRVRAIARRQSYVLWRAPQRWFDVVVWPVVDAVLFGAIGVYFGGQPGSAAGGATAGAAFLLAGIILFHVVFQAEVSVATGFLEETWSRNLLNLMVTPMTELEYGAGVALFGIAKLVIASGRSRSSRSPRSRSTSPHSGSHSSRSSRSSWSSAGRRRWS